MLVENRVVHEQVGVVKLTFLISEPVKPVKAFDRSEAATSLALPK